MKQKKPWITPTVELLSRGYVEGGNHPHIHESTGHPSLQTPNVHAPSGPGVIFFSKNGDAVTGFTNAASS